MLFPLIKHWDLLYLIPFSLVYYSFIHKFYLKQIILTLLLSEPSLGWSIISGWVVNYFGFAWSISVDYTY